MTDEFLLRVKEANDIVDVVSEYVKLRRSGKNYVGECPFHEEKTPSLRIYPETQSFYCFGCGAGKANETFGSDVIAFIMKLKNLEFEDAVKFLAERAGIPFEEKRDPNEHIYKRNVEFSRDSFMELYTNEDALMYLYQRGLSDEDLNNWRIGFASNDVYFHDRIIFPILDPRGKTVGFTSRRFPDNLEIEKCKHSPTSEVFKRNNLLYGLHEAKQYIRETGKVYIVEGPFDCIAMHIMGLKNTVATLGCHMSDEQMDIIVNKLHAEPILAYDGDFRGSQANAEAGKKFLSAGISPKVLVLPGELDPNDYMMRFDNNEEAVSQIHERTMDYCYFMIQRYVQAYDAKVLEAKREFYERANSFVDSIPEGALKDSMQDFINSRIKGGS